jgi:phosphotransferase system HPr-like phosphotransfer protein
MRTKPFLLIPLAILAVAVIGVPASQGADPFVAGERSSWPVAIDGSSSDRALSRALDVGRALAVGGVRQTVARFDDRFDHRVYDEVVSFDAHGREVALIRLDTDGGLLLAVRLGWTGGSGRAIAAAAADDTGAAIARSAGLSVDGTPEVNPSAGAGGWIVRWPRLVDGVPVRGDGVRVTIWSDGSFHAVTRNERPLHARPASVITAAAARSVAEGIVAGRFGASADALAVVAVEQAWVASNDTWDAARPDAPEATLRLAWVVRFRSSGALAERLRMAEFWLDAGDAALIGGDVAE